MRSPNSVITIADGIEIVAAKFEERYAPHQNKLTQAWHEWQLAARTLGMPHKWRGRHYSFPSTEIMTDAMDKDRVVQTMAKVSVRGTVQHVRPMRRAMRTIRRCEENGIELLQSGANFLWSIIEENTVKYAVTITPLKKGLCQDYESIQRPRAPIRREWEKDIDEGGTDMLAFHVSNAEETLTVVSGLTNLLNHGFRDPGPGNGERLTGIATEAGIAL